jgi:hypothetical protein
VGNRACYRLNSRAADYAALTNPPYGLSATRTVGQITLRDLRDGLGSKLPDRSRKSLAANNYFHQLLQIDD